MNLGKRDLDTLINCRVRERSETKKNVRILTIGFLLMVVGGMLFYAASLYGVVVAGVGTVIIAVGMVKQSRTEKQLRKSLMEDYNKTGVLPPYPEDNQDNYYFYDTTQCATHFLSSG